MEIVPHHKYFATQREDEEVLLMARRHWIVYLPAFLIGGIILFSCFILFFSLENITYIGSNKTIQAIIIMFLSIFMLFTVLIVYISWLVHYLNFQMVTNEHLVDVDQHGLFSREISELSLADIQDVSATQHGILQSVLHYGDVVIQTAGEKPNFQFERVKNPYAIARQIMEIKDKYGDESVRIEKEEPPVKEV